MFFIIDDRIIPQRLKVVISSSEWPYAQKHVLPLLPPPCKKELDGEGNKLWFEKDAFTLGRSLGFLAYIGKLEVFHAEFLLRALNGKPAHYRGSPVSASRLLRRIYKRLTPGGKTDPEAYVCDEKRDAKTMLLFHPELKLLAIFAGNNAQLLMGPDGEGLAALNSHFSSFDMTVEIEP